ncbi:MAG: aminodeoxychorismate/anthranilate synthase component II [Bacteroidetes bacterium]|nr:aminodeoxychorismate/anthranilate synthase component II [Bacteroidota bacterium]
MKASSGILIFDNYDSFTYNLVHLVEKLTHQKVDVCFNDRLELDRVNAYDKIILSPGPGIPAEAGLMPELINRYSSSKQILGVCLGHQAIAENFGAKLLNLPEVYHGVATPVRILDKENVLFRGLPGCIEAGRYHSWIVSKEELPSELLVTAEDEHGYIMALKHRQYNVQGVQFHPESILTPFGEQIIRNWLEQ